MSHEPIDDLRGRAAELAAFIGQFEEENELHGLSTGSRAAIRDAVKQSGFQAMNMPADVGGAGLSTLEQVVVMEQLGRITNHMWHLVLKPANVLVYCTAQQRETYLYPAIAGDVIDCYSVSEPGAGSDVRAIETTAVARDGGWVINGEKWFASAFDIADVIILLARVQPGDQYTLFLVDRQLPGVELKHIPLMMGKGVYEHPQYTLTDVHVSSDAVLGEVGAGLELTREWFTEERLFVAARSVGGAQRALELTVEWTRERQQGGAHLIDHQLVQGALADCAVEIALNRALLYEVAREADAGLGTRPDSDDAKRLHARAAMTKLAASEAAGRVVDTCLQLFGGRAYAREHPVERLYRAVRAERIWEGTSDIQRLIVANEIKKRGLSELLGVAPEQPAHTAAAQ